jgi:hypothetical protein
MRFFHAGRFAKFRPRYRMLLMALSVQETAVFLRFWNSETISELLQRLQAFFNLGDCVEGRIHSWDLIEYQLARIHKILKYKHFRHNSASGDWQERISFKIEWPLFVA